MKWKVMKTRKTPTELRPRNQGHDMKSSYKQQSGRNLKMMSQHKSWKSKKTIRSRHNTEVATSTLKEH